MTDEAQVVANWQPTFATMRDQWGRSVDQQQSHRITTELEQVNVWQDTFRKLRGQKEGLRKKYLWYSGRPDLLAIIGRTRRELFHSAMIAWLADPGAPTGLGSAFLRQLLYEVGAEYTEEELDFVQIACEATGARQRTDLLIQGETFTVAIEVKVDSGEGRNQCLRMYKDYQHYPGVRFVFLTPSGREPSDDVKDEFTSLGFPRIAAMLVDAIRDDESYISQIGAQSLASRAHDTLIGGIATTISYLHTLRKEFA